MKRIIGRGLVDAKTRTYSKSHHLMGFLIHESIFFMVYQIAIRIFEYYGTSLIFLKTQYSGEIEKRKENTLTYICRCNFITLIYYLTQ